MKRLLPILLATALVPGALPAQFIPLKTLPIASGDQFQIFPSQTAAMGRVSIALRDSLFDPFLKPATGGRVQGTRLFAAPGFYGVAEEGGAGGSLPFGLASGSSTWFGGGAVAVQQLEPASTFACCFVQPVGGREPATSFIPGQELLSEQSAVNLYASGYAGRRLTGTPFTVAVGASYADLSAVEGVDLLYALSQRIEQRGHVADLRLGLVGDLEGDQSLEAVALYQGFRMTHDVTYLDFVLVDTLNWIWEPSVRVESNLDRTDTWGLQLNYDRPLGTQGWRIGGILTGNWKSHPKIPNYEIMNIPRDPGSSTAWNLGVGVANGVGPARFGLDLIYEPIRSHTWAEAESLTVKPGGGTIPPGGATVDNRFEFSNALIRTGAGYEYRWASLQLGVEMRSIHYTLEQQDFVVDSFRRQTEHWVEWTPTWGASVTLPQLTVRYIGRLTTGTGRPGVAWGGGAIERLAAAEAADFIVAPGGPLTLQDAKVVAHQIAVILPIR